MIKRDVLHRADIKTVYSSERQERMKVYFELSEQYNQCIEPCKLQPNEAKEDCLNECEKIYDQYAQILKDRYENNKERLDMEVNGLPSYRKRPRPDRQGWFYDLFGVSFKEFVGVDTTPSVNTEPRLI
jgi:hypothetical protein